MRSSRNTLADSRKSLPAAHKIAAWAVLLLSMTSMPCARPQDRVNGGELLTAFSARVCERGTVKADDGTLELPGPVRLQLKDLITQLSALGAQGAPSYSDADGEEQLQKELASLVGRGPECRARVLAKLVDTLIAGPEVVVTGREDKTELLAELQLSNEIIAALDADIAKLQKGIKSVQANSARVARSDREMIAAEAGLPGGGSVAANVHALDDLMARGERFQLEQAQQTVAQERDKKAALVKRNGEIKKLLEQQN
jgi:hypothetical protein